MMRKEYFSTQPDVVVWTPQRRAARSLQVDRSIVEGPLASIFGPEARMTSCREAAREKLLGHVTTPVGPHRLRAALH